MQHGNIFSDIPAELPKEVIEVLARNDSVKIERIISKGHASPDTGWYDQQQNEWVIILKGAAEIAFENGPTICLGEGDFVDIPARRRHRVVRTSGNPETIWLAIHF